jgi:hypothetical protein
VTSRDRQKTRPARDRRERDGSGWSGWLDLIDLEGVLIFLAIGVALVLGWAVIELLMPALAFAAYVAVVGALRRVAHDDHGCEGRPGRAALWGVTWATIYTVPLVALVWLARWMFGRG